MLFLFDKLIKVHETEEILFIVIRIFEMLTVDSHGIMNTHIHTFLGINEGKGNIQVVPPFLPSHSCRQIDRSIHDREGNRNVLLQLCHNLQDGYEWCPMD